MSERDELDLLIDSALADYAEPRPGLERRMLARISTKPMPFFRYRWVLAIAAPVVVCVLLFAYLVLRTPHSQPGNLAYTPAEPPPARVEAMPVHNPAPKSLTTTHIRRVSHKADRVLQNTVPRPKLDVFPTPQPLSTGEQALIRFVAQATEADRKALVEAQQRVDQPLDISAIRIPPLQLPEDDNH